MKNYISESTYVFLALLITFSFSCTLEDDDGATQEEQSLAEESEENTNVKTFTYDASSFTGTYTEFSIPEITQDVIENEVVLTYLTDDGSYWISPSQPTDHTIKFDFLAHTVLTVGTLILDYDDASGSKHHIDVGDLETFKVIIIKSPNTISKKAINTKQQIINELNQVGINMNDYYAVCNYYGIDY
ncbi:MAG: hypothetical protein ACTJHS_06320 [Mesonia sp.]